MSFALAFLPVVLICVPVLGSGLWLVKQGKTRAARCAGVVLTLVGGLPALLTLLFLYWLVFHAE